MKLALLSIFLALPLAAQTKPTDKPEPTPALSKEEKLELENLQLKSQLLQTQQQAIQAAANEFFSTLNTEHPGWSYNIQAQQFVKTPKAEEPAKAAK